ncbi:organic solute transporter Ostalpha-domain-containing protein [Fomes fomentarius]|nr:organic solute transporter Ostalpha-domain-containing protein [Fomes fomentarius]
MERLNYNIGWIVSSAFTLIAIGVSFWLIGKHLQWYTNKYEQRYIVRILFMVPLYAVISTASYFWWNHATPLILLRDGYEATVLTAFFYLLLLYISPDVNEQKEIFRKDGLYFLQLMKWGVLQYCVVRPGTTLAAVILDYAGLYCEESWSLGWGHIYIILVVSISVTIGMYCLIQLYMVTKEQLAPQKPLLKLFAIKAVVFLTFWQATFLSILSLFGIVKDTPYMTANNINIGIGAILETVEMAIFACLHIKAFSYKPYRTGGEPTPRWRALAHAMNFKETGRELWQGTVYMIRKYRGREVDAQARREAVLENVFGRSRFDITREAGSSRPKVNSSEKDVNVTVEVEKEVRVGDERQWLGVGDDYIYGLGYQARRQRERSEGLESQIEKELVRRGYSIRGAAAGGAYAPIVDTEAAPAPGHQRTQASWWRRVYNRLSQSGLDPETEGSPSLPSGYPHARRRSASRRRSRDVKSKGGTAPLMADVQEDDYNDPPPPSAIRTYRESKNKSKNSKGWNRQSPPTFDPPLLFTSFGDIPSPLSSPEARSDVRPVIRPQVPAMLLPLGATLPLPTASAQSLQADSFLDRAFAASVEPGSSVEVLSAGPSSSQSHYHHPVCSRYICCSSICFRFIYCRPFMFSTSRIDARTRGTVPVSNQPVIRIIVVRSPKYGFSTSFPPISSSCLFPSSCYVPRSEWSINVNDGRATWSTALLSQTGLCSVISGTAEFLASTARRPVTPASIPVAAAILSTISPIPAAVSFALSPPVAHVAKSKRRILPGHA